MNFRPSIYDVLRYARGDFPSDLFPPWDLTKPLEKEGLIEWHKPKGFIHQTWPPMPEPPTDSPARGWFLTAAGAELLEDWELNHAEEIRKDNEGRLPKA